MTQDDWVYGILGGTVIAFSILFVVLIGAFIGMLVTL